MGVLGRPRGCPDLGSNKTLRHENESRTKNPLKPQDVLLPLHNRSVQVLLARAQPDPKIIFGSSHGSGLGLLPICSRNLDAAQCLLFRLPLSIRCQLLLQLSPQRGFAFCRPEGIIQRTAFLPGMITMMAT